MTTDSNYKGVSRRTLNMNAANLGNQLALQNIDFAEYPDVKTFVLHIAFEGTAAQKSAVANSFPMKCTFATPEIHTTDRVKALKTAQYLEREIKLLSAEHGVSYSGDPSTMAMDILTEFGGMTHLDCIKFFHNAKLSKYKTEMQHVSARGITREFLIDWLNKYLDEREEARHSILNDISEVNKTGSIEETYEKANPAVLRQLRAEADKRTEMVRKAHSEGMKQPDDQFYTNNLFGITAEDGKLKYRAWKDGFRQTIEENQKKLGPELNKSQYADLEEKRLLAEIKRKYNKTTAQDMCWFVVEKSQTTAQDFKTKTGHDASQGVFRFEVNKVTTTLNNLAKKKWYKYAEKKYSAGETPEPQESWAKNKCRKYYLDRFGYENDMFYEIITQ